MQLSIIIPAYNEEQSIGSIIERTLQARAHIIQTSSVDQVELIIVNDGSHDKTKEIVAQNIVKHKEIDLISYDKNKGYGAAIKMGFSASHGELVSFLDADGTCDPNFFANLVNALEKNNADISIGSRLGKNSKMPKIRRLGNMIYANIINFFGNVNITDSASGMRVLRRESLAKLYPLPDGLHFTPAMSCKAILNKDLKICEQPMSYEEREGESKLSVVKDGMRFLKIIGEIALFYKPLKFFLIIGICLITIGSLYSIRPILHLLMQKHLEQWFIYRVTTIMVCFVAGFNFIMLAFFADGLASLMGIHEDIFYKKKIVHLQPLLYPKNIFKFGFIITFCAIAFNYRGIFQYITTGEITIHWAYVLVGALGVLLGIQLFAFGILHKILNMYKVHKELA